MNVGARFLVYFLCFTQLGFTEACIAILIGAALEVAAAFVTEFFRLA